MRRLPTDHLRHVTVVVMSDRFAYAPNSRRPSRRQLGVDMANTFMLTLLFNLIADMSENPDGVSNGHKNGAVRFS